MLIEDHLTSSFFFSHFRIKLFALRPNDSGAKEWKELGVAMVRLLKDEDSNKVRLLIRSTAVTG